MLLSRCALRCDLGSHEWRNRLIRLEVQVASAFAAPRSVLAGNWRPNALVRHKGAIHQLPRGTATHHTLDVEDLYEPGNPYHHDCPPRGTVAWPG